MKKHKILLSTIALALLLGGCTKESPKKEEPKFDVESKSLVSSEEMLFAASTGRMSRTSEYSRPYSFAENKRVKVVMEENSLRILEVEKDARFKANPTNDKLVLSIPIKHLGYKCQTDAFNECTNSEVEDNSIPWQQKPFFKVQYAETDSGQLDFLPVNFEANILGSACFTQVSSRVISAKIDADALNFTIEKSFRVGLLCAGRLEETADSTVTAEFHYSMVRASAVVSPNYAPIKYPSKDQNTFGFFSTERTVLDSTNNATESGKISLMNRWNPNRSEIVYHLTDNFYKPENSTILALTRKTVASLNDGLAKSGVNFKIRLSDELGKNPGDIRNSMIVLVEDPVSAGLLGYGPQTEDPRTGEIVSARTVMFLGTSNQIVRRTYEQLLEERRKEVGAAITQSASTSQTSAKLELSADLRQEATLRKASARSLLQNLAMVASTSGKASVTNSNALTTQGSAFVSQSRIQQARDSLKSYTRNTSLGLSRDDTASQFRYLNEMKNCDFVVPNEGVLDALSPALKAALAQYTKPWVELSAADQRAIADIIVPVTWEPTLLHELGHNLGLRHNFQGSEDKANFYSDAELKALNVDHKIPSSSIMEYIEDIRALPVLGKYDIAALRFGYKREVELKDGKVITVQSTINETSEIPEDSLKDYGFCTDEHTGINAGCRRFDLGTTYTEIVENSIAQYKEFYRERNRRNDRANFSLYDDVAYARRVQKVFRDLRLMLEVSERIKGLGFDYSNKVWQEQAFLKDLRQATIKSGQFMMEVLSTPDLTCVAAEATKPNEIVAIERLVKISKKKGSCFDLTDELPAGLIIIAEFGKSVQSIKLETSTNAYADQIDIRGVWSDKLMAMRTLFERKIGVHNLDVQGGDNFADIPELRQPLQELTLAMAINKLEKPVELRFADGSTQELAAPIETYESFVLPEMVDRRLSRALSIPEQQTPFIDLMVTEIPDLMVTHPSKKESEKVFAEAYKIRLTNPITDPIQLPTGYVAASLSAEETFYASPLNVLAKAAIQERQALVVGNLLAQVPAEELQKIIAAKAAAQEKPAELSPAGTAVWELPQQVLEMFVKGEIPKGETKFFDTLIRALPIR